MVSITFEAIYSRFLSKVEAYELIEMLEDDAYDTMEEWLKSVYANPRLRKMFKSCSIDKAVQTLDCELKNSQGDEESDSELIIELFGLGIAWKWVTPRYLSTLNAAQMISGKEVKFFSQSNHLAELSNMYKNTKQEFYNTIRDYGVLYNSYLANNV